MPKFTKNEQNIGRNHSNNIGSLAKQFFMPIKRFWNNISFHKKTILYASIILYFCILAFGMLIYNQAVESMDQIEEESTLQRIVILDENVKALFKNFEVVTNTLLLDANFQEKLETCPESMGEIMRYDKELANHLSALCNSVKSTAGWDLYFTYDRKAPTRENIHFLSNAEGNAWFSKLISQKRNVITWHLEQTSPAYNSYFICGLGIANRDTGYIPAYFKMAVDLSSVVSVIRPTTEQVDAVFLLCSQEGNIIWSNNNSADYSDYILPYGKDTSFLEPVTVSGSMGQRTVVALDGGKYGYTIMCIYEPKDLFSQFMEFGRFFLFVLIVVILFSFVLLHASANIVTGRIRRLTTDVKTLDGTNLHYVADLTSKDEIGELSRAFSDLINRIKLLIEQERRHEEERFELEVEALQAQINPHFLFNTLSIINRLACNIEADNISQAINSLANFYRYALNDGKKMTTLRQELRMLDDYFAICAMRYSSEVKIQKDIDVQALDCVIPKLILQPFCENALFHGFSGEFKREPIISIGTKLEEDHLLIVIADNGVGMSANELQHAWETGFAIRNVHRRTQMLYGDQCGVSISSVPSQGTQVIIKIGLIDETTENK